MSPAMAAYPAAFGWISPPDRISVHSASWPRKGVYRSMYRPPKRAACDWIMALIACAP